VLSEQQLSALHSGAATGRGGAGSWRPSRGRSPATRTGTWRDHSVSIFQTRDSSYHW